MRSVPPRGMPLYLHDTRQYICYTYGSATGRHGHRADMNAPKAEYPLHDFVVGAVLVGPSGEIMYT
eukprot:5360889-Heterocapsa_arctica.AAC.1